MYERDPAQSKCLEVSGHRVPEIKRAVGGGEGWCLYE